MKLWEHLKERMLRYPMQMVCENDAEMTFEELVIFAEEYAKRLKDIRCCAILCDSEMASAMALLSCFAAGVTALPLSKRYGDRHCNKILETISPDAVITDQDGDFQLFQVTDSSYIVPQEQPALIMCTSGTTGTPKGAMLTQQNILTNLGDITAYFRLIPSDTILIARPLYHAAVLTGEFLTALIHGARIRFYSGNFNPTKVLKLLVDHPITVFCGTPTLLNLMARLRRQNMNICMRIICVSGECMDKETARRIMGAFPQALVYHVYGLTEACPRVSYLPAELFAEHPDCVGFPLRSVQVKIVKENGTLASENEVGVLWIKGGNIMTGYYNEPSKTKAVLKNGWLCTGDLALINENGLLQIKGRTDDLIIKAGMNIYPQEIEAGIKSDPRVTAVYVWGEKDKDLGTQICMNIEGDFSDVHEVKTLCKACLPPYQIPTRINLVDVLPRNGSGKRIKE